MIRIIILFFAASFAACNGNSNHKHDKTTDDTSSSHSNHNNNTSATNPMQAEMDKMMTGMMALQLSGDPDHDFAQLMKAHHQAAVDMANLQLQKGKDSITRAFAQAVIQDQSKEISEFDRFLQQAKPANTDQQLSDSMMQAMHQYMEPHQPLKNDIDHDFLALMIPHHQSAVVMTEIYLQKGKDKRLRQLGNTIIKNQKKEIEQMKSWLKSK
jgi:uncharacterized protein (DUF305 family)